MGPAIGSASAKYTRGTNVLDIRDFGADPKNAARANRIAIQAALDSAAKVTGLRRVGVYVPSGLYEIDRNLFVTGQNIDIFGDGPGVSTLFGSCTMLHLGVKQLAPDPSLGVLADAYGILDTSASSAPGSRYGLDISKYRIWDQAGLMFRNGGVLWSTMRQFTIDGVVDLTGWTDSTPGPTWLSVCGWDSGLATVPGEPWFIQAERANGQYRIRFYLSLAKNPPRESMTYLVATDWTSDPVVRFTAQVDLDGHGGGTGPVVVMYANRVQSASSVVYSWNAPSSLAPGGRLLDTFLRPFMVGTKVNESPIGGRVFGVRVQTGLRYQYKSSGEAQAYVAGGTINDQSQYFTNGSEVLFLLPFYERPSDIQAHPSIVVAGGGALEPIPLSSAIPGVSELVPFNLVGSTISSLGLMGSGIGAGAGLLIQGVVNSCFSDLRINGVGTAISTFGNVSYSNYFRNLDLSASSAMLALRSSSIQSFSEISSGSSAPWVFICADNTCGASISDWMVSPNNLTVHYVYSEGASFDFCRFSADNEGASLLGACEFYFESGGVLGGASVSIDGMGIGAGSYRRPNIVLGGSPTRDVNNPSNGNSRAKFYLKSSRISDERSQPARIRVDSPMWEAQLRQDAVYERGPMVLDNTPGKECRVKLDDFWMNGPPRSSFWDKNMAKLHPPDMVSGRPLEYVCVSAGGYGTATPPRWFATKVCDDDPSRLAADLVGHCYWSTGALPSETIFGFWSDAVQVQNLDWLFRQVAPSVPGLPTSLAAATSRASAYRSKLVGEVPTGLGYSRQPVTFTFPRAGRAEASAVSFGPATSAWDDDGWGSLTSAVAILDESGNLIASADFAPISMKAGGSLAFPSGGVFMEHAPVAGSSFSPMVEDALAKAWLGGSQLPVWNLHLALSTGEADVSTGPVEPSDPGYGRVAAPTSAWTPATSTLNWNSARVFASGQDDTMSCNTAVVTNARSLDFAAPTVDWGTVRSVYLMDAAQGGNVVAVADLVLPRAVKAGSPAPGFDVGALRVVRS